MLRLTCLIAVAGSVVFAQPGNVAGPSTGYVLDSAAQTLRQVRGIAGAATMGDPIDLGMPIIDAAISPRGDAAIVTAVADDSMHLFRLANGTATEITSIKLGASGVAVFSPTGAAAALYRPDGVQVLRGLPDAPEVAFTAPIKAALARPVMGAMPTRVIAMGRIAVSDDATVLLHSSQGSVEVVTAAGSRKLASAPGSAPIAFAPRSHDAAVVSGGKLSVFQDVTGAATRQDFPNASAIAAVGFSADGAKVAMAGQRAVTVLDRTSGSTHETSCDCTIGTMTGMGTMFRLNEPGDGPVWLLDPADTEPRLVFVPAIAVQR
jgi:hypothetical protein